MKKFSELLVDLIYCSSNNEKIRIIIKYLDEVDIEESGYTIAALTNNLKFKNIKNFKVKEIVKSRIDKNLFNYSYDYAGDLADTISLIWKTKSNTSYKTNLSEVIKCLNNINTDLEAYLIKFLDNSNVNERWALIKLLLGGFRVGVSEKLVKKALAIYGDKKLDDIEKIWNALSPPYKSLIKWLKNEGKYPKIRIGESFLPMMLASPINLEKDIKILKPEKYLIEYKWDGIRVQLSCENYITKIYTRSGENITGTFPEINLFLKELIILDGELLAGKNFSPYPFNSLQKRLNKLNPTKKLLRDCPVFIRAYDILFYEKQDLRNHNLIYRKKKLNLFMCENKNISNIDTSEIINFTSIKNLKKTYAYSCRSKLKEGLMIKNKFSSYLAGRKKGLWIKWKRSPKYIDAILIYAQRGHGKRSSYFSDFTFGVFLNKNIVPIAKAYSGYTDNELLKLDKFVRENTLKTYGPVREIKKKLVVELAFDSMQPSKRHKSGVSLRFPRFHRIRWDKPYEETISLECLKEEFLN